jgi:hypothetical protein
LCRCYPPSLRLGKESLPLGKGAAPLGQGLGSGRGSSSNSWLPRCCSTDFEFPQLGPKVIRTTCDYFRNRWDTNPSLLMFASHLAALLVGERWS